MQSPQISKACFLICKTELQYLPAYIKPACCSVEPSRQGVITVHVIACNAELLHLATESPQPAHSVGWMLEPSISWSGHFSCESISSPVKFRHLSVYSTAFMGIACCPGKLFAEVFHYFRRPKMGVAVRSQNLSETTNNSKHIQQTVVLTIETGPFLMCNFFFQQNCQWNDIIISPLHELAYLEAT